MMHSSTCRVRCGFRYITKGINHDGRSRRKRPPSNSGRATTSSRVDAGERAGRGRSDGGWSAVSEFPSVFSVVSGSRRVCSSGAGPSRPIGESWLRVRVSRRIGVLRPTAALGRCLRRALPWLVLAAIEALSIGLFGATAAALSRLPCSVVWIASVWVLLEGVRSRLPFGGFPWGRLAFGQADGVLLPLAGVAVEPPA